MCALEYGTERPHTLSLDAAAALSAAQATQQASSTDAFRARARCHFLILYRSKQLVVELERGVGWELRATHTSHVRGSSVSAQARKSLCARKNAYHSSRYYHSLELPYTVTIKHYYHSSSFHAA